MPVPDIVVFLAGVGIVGGVAFALVIVVSAIGYLVAGIKWLAGRGRQRDWQRYTAPASPAPALVDHSGVNYARDPSTVVRSSD